MSESATEAMAGDKVLALTTPWRDDTADDLRTIFAEAPHLSATQALNWLETVRGIARALHRVYVRQCNGYVGTGRHAHSGEDTAARMRDEERERLYETQLRAHFEGAGLGLYLNTDPRGNPVGILTPKSGRYNTMGGREAGWRL